MTSFEEAWRLVDELKARQKEAPVYMTALEAQLVKACYEAGMFQIEQMKKHPGRWKWSTNYMREHARCASGLKFTNSISPRIYALVGRLHPELKSYIETDAIIEDEPKNTRL